MRKEIIEKILNEFDNTAYTKHEIWDILKGIEDVEYSGEFKEDLQTGVWLDVGDPQYLNVPEERLIIKFDNGEVLRGGEQYHFAMVTHVLILPL